jgi:hypothetical protein
MLLGTPDSVALAIDEDAAAAIGLGAGTITPVITASRCTTSGETCAAPLAVSFNAHEATTCSTAECDDSPIDNELFHTLDYEWDFGDPGSGTWAANGQSRNVEYGPLGAHVYEAAGTYTVELCVRSATDEECTTTDIIVDDPDVVFDEITKCFSNDTDFTGCPVSVESGDRHTADDFDAAVAAYIDSGFRRFLFKGGDTFSLSAETELEGRNGGSIGCFGSCPALIDGTSSLSNFISVNVNNSPSDDWRIYDFEVTQQQSGNAFESSLIARGGSGGGSGTASNFLWLRVDHPDGGGGIGSNHGQPITKYGDPYLYVVDCVLRSYDLESPQGPQNYPFYAATDGGAVMGSTFGKSAALVGNTKFFRSQPRYRNWLIAHNVVEGGMEAGVSIRGTAPDNAGTPQYISQFLVFRGNDLSQNSNDSGFQVEIPEQGSYQRDIIIEANRFAGRMQWEARSVTARNNLYGADFGPMVKSTCNMEAGWVRDSMIYNNSTNRGTYGIKFEDQTACDEVAGEGHIVKNNLSPNAADPVNTDAGIFGTPVEEANLGSGDFSATPWASDPPLLSDPTHWELTGAGAAAALKAGTDLGSAAMREFDGTLRTPPIDVGAIQTSATFGVPALSRLARGALWFAFAAAALLLLSRTRVALGR